MARGRHSRHWQHLIHLLVPSRVCDGHHGARPWLAPVTRSAAALPRGLAVVQPKVAGRLVHWPGALPSDWPPPSARRAPPTQSPIPKMPTSQRPKLRREHRPKMASRGVRHSTATISSQSTQHDQRARFLTQVYTRYVRIQCTSNGFNYTVSFTLHTRFHSLRILSR